MKKQTQQTFRFAPVALGAILLALSPLLPGCGGNNDTPATVVAAPKPVAMSGRAQITVVWPSRSTGRLIPKAAKSIRIDVLRASRDNALFRSQIVNRGDNDSQVVTLDRLPVEPLLIHAEAFPQEGGGGVAQATGNSDNLVTPTDSDTPAGFRLVMGSTIETLSAEPIAKEPLKAGQKHKFVAVARDKDKNPVMIWGDNVTWKVDDNSPVASVAPDGTVTALAPGTATIIVHESESGKTGTATITVVLAPTPPPPTPTPPPLPELPTMGILALQRWTNADTNDAEILLYRFDGAGATQSALRDLLPPDISNTLNPRIVDGVDRRLVFYGIRGGKYEVFESSYIAPAETRKISVAPELAFHNQDARYGGEFGAQNQTIAFVSNNEAKTDPRIFMANRETLAISASSPTENGAPLRGRQPLSYRKGLFHLKDENGVTNFYLYTFADKKDTKIDLKGRTGLTYLTGWDLNRLLLTMKGTHDGKVSDDLYVYDIEKNEITPLAGAINTADDEGDPASLNAFEIFFARTVQVGSERKYRVFLYDVRYGTVRQIDEITKPDANKSDLGLSYRRSF